MANNKERIIGFKIVLNGSEKTIKSIAEVELELAALAKQIREAKKAGDQATYEKLRIEQENLKETSKRLRAELNEQKKAFEKTKFNAGSYKALDAQLGALRARYRELSEAERESGIGRTMLADIKNLDQKLKGIDAQLGNFQRNVGNYAGGLRGLFKGLQSQLNSTALFGRIGNLPALFNTFTGAIESVQKAVQEFFDNYDAMYNASALVQKKFQAAQDETIKQYVAVRTETDGLLKTANDKTKSDVEQQQAVDQLNEIYKQYLPNLAQEELTLEQLNVLKPQLNDAIIKEIALKQQAKIVDELRNEALLKGLALDKVRKDAAQSTILSLTGLEGILQQQADTANKAVVEATKSSASFENTLRDIERIAKESGVEDFFAVGFDPTELSKNNQKVAEENKKTQEKAAEEAKKAADLLIKIQIEFAKESERIRTDTAKKLEAQRIAAIENERDRNIAEERNSLEAFKRAQQAELDAHIETQKEKIKQARENKNISNAEIVELEQKLQGEITQLSKDSTKIVENEIVESNKRIAKINEDFAKQQAEARARIQADALRAALDAQEGSLARKEAGAQTVSIQFDFDEQASQQAFSQAKAELDLQLAQGNITQLEYEQQLQDANVKRLEEEAAITQKRLDIERQIGAEIVAQTQAVNNSRLTIALAEIEAERQARLTALEDELKQGIISQQEYEAARVGVVEESETKIKNTKAETEEANAQLAQEFNNKIVSGAKDVAIKQVEIEAEKANALTDLQQEQSDKLKEYASFAADTINEAFDLVNNFIQQSLDAQIEKINERYDREAVLAFGNAEKIKAIEDKRAKDIDKINKRAAALRKAQAITQAIINGALGVTNILANLIDPTPIQAFKAVQIGIVGALTAANVAVIAAQKFAKGGSMYELLDVLGDGGEVAPSDLAPIGYVQGPSHEQGGVKYATPKGIVEVEGGEMIDVTDKGRVVAINKRSTSMFRSQLERMNGVIFKGKDEMLSRINAFAGAGKRFQLGGGLTDPLPAPIVEVNNKQQDVAELRKQNELLQESNANLLDLILATQQMVVNLTVTADARQITELGQEEIKKAQTKNL